MGVWSPSAPGRAAGKGAAGPLPAPDLRLLSLLLFCCLCPLLLDVYLVALH